VGSKWGLTQVGLAQLGLTPRGGLTRSRLGGVPHASVRGEAPEGVTANLQTGNQSEIGGR